MPKKRNINYDEARRKIIRRYKDRGYNIIDDESEIRGVEKNEKEKQPIQESGEKRKLSGDSKNNNLEKKVSQEFNPVIKPKSVVRGASKPLQKLHSVYKTIEDKALYLSPVLDVDFSNGNNLSLGEGKTDSITLGGEAYNSTLLYTILTSVMDKGKMLVCGPPGSGKTSSSRFIGSAVNNLLVDYIKHATIYGHPEQTEEKMIAMFDPIKMIKGERKLIVRDFLKSPIKVIDEVNRLRPESLSILYELLNSGSVTYQGQLIKARSGPLFATANASDSGNYDIPPPFMDRFNVAVFVDTINPYYLESFAKQRIGNRNNLESMVRINDPLTPQDLGVIKRGIYNVNLPSEEMGKIAHFLAELSGCDMAGVSIERKTKGNTTEKKPPALCNDCHFYGTDKSICYKTEDGLSARALESVVNYSKALAYWRGKGTVGEEDVRAVVPYATWFRVTPTRAAFEKEPRYINDRIGLMKGLFDTSSQSYAEIVKALPEYKHITSLVYSGANGNGSQVNVQKNEIKKMIETAGKLDSTAKFPLILSLKKMYNYAK
ncbi:AAA family ATPase [Candidatus Woesearchaeota archaeon]|nr:AAA family ATPase [Candidatus Woesearchaeota archaeon]